MIDLAFYGKGPGRRRKTAQRVLDQWKEYLDHLSDRDLRDRDSDGWASKGADLQVELLVAIGQDVGFIFDRVQLRKGAYNPEAHGRMEDEQNLVRRLAINVLEGRTPLSMNVASFPVDEDALRAQMELSTKLGGLIADGEIKVRVVASDGAPPSGVMTGPQMRQA